MHSLDPRERRRSWEDSEKELETEPERELSTELRRDREERGPGTEERLHCTEPEGLRTAV